MTPDVDSFKGERSLAACEVRNMEIPKRSSVERQQAGAVLAKALRCRGSAESVMSLLPGP